MKYLLDTNTVSAWAKRSSPAVLRKMLALSPSELGISALVEHELRYGLALHPQWKAGPAVEALLGTIEIIPFGSEQARCAAEIRADLSRRGQPIGPYDVLIAAAALANKLTLVTHNTREFSRVTGLELEDWIEPS